MAEADLVVEEVYETKMIHPQYLEPRIAAAQMEPNGRLTVWANAQAPFPVRQETAKMLGLRSITCASSPPAWAADSAAKAAASLQAPLSSRSAACWRSKPSGR